MPQGSKTRLGALTNIEVPVADLGAAVEWYRERLGFELQWRGEGQAFVALPGEGVRFFLVETADPARLGFRNSRAVAHGVADFYAEDLPAVHAALRAQGVEVDDLAPGAYGFGFRDLAGNRFGVHRDRGSFEHRRSHPTQ